MLNNEKIIPTDFVLINENNANFLKGKVKFLVPEQEIFLNINRQLGLPLILLEEERPKAIIFSILFGLFVSFTSIALLYTGLDFFQKGIGEPLSSGNILVSVIIIFPSSLVSLVLSYASFSYLFSVIKYDPEITHKKYQALIEEGSFLEGEISSVRRLSNVEIEIKYSFTNTLGRMSRGIYVFRSVYNKLRPRNKIIILYLDDKVHVLL